MLLNPPGTFAGALIIFFKETKTSQKRHIHLQPFEAFANTVIGLFPPSLRVHVSRVFCSCFLKQRHVAVICIECGDNKARPPLKNKALISMTGHAAPKSPCVVQY